jgi:hypothetical protein
VRVHHAQRRLAEEPQARLDTQPLQVRMHGDWHARHQRHGEPWPAILGHTGLEDGRHRAVIHHRQRLLLRTESRQHAPAVHAALEQLHGRQAPHRPMLRTQQHHAVSTLPQLTHDLEGPQAIRHALFAR